MVVELVADAARIRRITGLQILFARLHELG